MAMPMMVSQMTYPTAILLGPGVVACLGERCRQLGMKRPLLLTDKGIVEQGIAERIEGILSGEGLLASVFSAVVAHPGEREIESAVEAHLAHGSDGVVALGGGSVIDTAKLMRLLATHERPLSRYCLSEGGARFVTGNMPPMIAVPTSAGAGAEVSPSATARLEGTGRTEVFAARALMPDGAICDPELATSLPTGPTAWTGMAAFAGCLEAFCACGLHPLADALAIDGLARCVRSLIRAIQDPHDLGARTDLMVASMESGIAAEKGLGVCAAIADAVGVVAGVRQGLAAAICLNAVLEYNRPAIGGRLAKIALAFGEPSNSPQSQLAASAADRVLRLTLEANIPSGLKEAGVRVDQLDAIVDVALEHRSLATNPRSVTRDDLQLIVREVY